MTPRSAQASFDAEPASTAEARPLPEVIQALLGSTEMVDLAYPCPSAIGCSELAGVAMLRLPRTDVEAEFLLRFRQAGGHHPISTIDLGDRSSSWPPPQIVQERGAVLVWCRNFDAAAEACKALRETGCAFAIPERPQESSEATDAQRALDGYRSVRLIDRAGGPSFRLLLSETASAAGESELSREMQSGELAFKSDGSKAVVEARRMIHDGGHVNEGDQKYSWLWTGPAAHFRLIVPQIAGARPRFLELCIPRTEDDSNLDLLAVQIDGRPVGYQLERWSSNSGKLCIEIPAGEDYAVLTLIVPRLSHDAQSGRMLGLCLDKLILTP